MNRLVRKRSIRSGTEKLSKACNVFCVRLYNLVVVLNSQDFNFLLSSEIKLAFTRTEQPWQRLETTVSCACLTFASSVILEDYQWLNRRNLFALKKLVYPLAVLSFLQVEKTCSLHPLRIVSILPKMRTFKPVVKRSSQPTVSDIITKQVSEHNKESAVSKTT